MRWHPAASASLRPHSTPTATHVMASGATACLLVGEMAPLAPTKLNVKGLVTRGSWSTTTVSVHAVPDPPTVYDTPATTGHAEPSLKSLATTPVTAEVKVAVTMKEVLLVGLAVLAVSVGVGGL